MLDQIARFFLLFSDNIVIIPLLIIGFIWLDRATFYHAVCLILFSILVNVALKVTFQIPLSPSLGKKGYAFPSGHMQLVTVLYTWLAFKINQLWLRVIIIALLLGIGLSLIHFDYHDYYDVLAGIFFAALLLISYYFASLKWPQNLPWFILGIASFLMIYIHWRTVEILSHTWMAYYALWGLIIAEQIANKKAIASVRSHKLLATLLCFASILGVHTFFRYVITLNQPAPIYQLQWLFIGFIIPWTNFSVAGSMKRYKPKS
ncbi:phosphatase PAP2 family protein [Legionella micdadei]|uniref:Undecaprenyl-diphosphatase n=1 Tax=Legionella micdadei TaxID=451 RepID=A0A098GAU6_LEGMI|nr:phosphatase PAP2 family protein [Legionella micdadei]ARG96347.1 hypothetical protein B6N58_00855 [Legionella micdadei]ARG99098.1 hypothetical protein B6V88_00850 [Legionella micdadei]KTD29570.1 PAP2 superfamily protein [Legionella micdadei]NSL18033.1 phosphatase PAP2 family protein [Legionella micdadei]CEG59548.1 membrane protein of unknown function [Phosphatidic acid phosphatase type 2/haloperoxidase] [Legionella micdadei]